MLSVVLAMSLAFPAKDGRARDPWFGRDKLKHFVAAASVQSLSYAAFRAGGSAPVAARWRATFVTAGVSLGKEGVDRWCGTAFSLRDLTWDAAGAGVATVAIIHLTRH